MKMEIEKKGYWVYAWLEGEIVYEWDTEEFTEKRLSYIVQKLEKYFGEKIEVVEKA